MFADQVQIEYYDAAQPTVQQQFARWIQEAETKYWPFPLVIVNEQVAMAGEVNAYRISRIVDQELRGES